MRFVCKTKIEKVWLVAAVGIFLTHRLLEASSPEYYPFNPLALWLEVAMVALSFPLGGLTMFVIQDAMFWCDDCRNLEFLFDWSTLLFAGYVQWFWLLPEFLRRRKPTFLNLKRPPETVSPDAAHAIAESSTSVSCIATMQVAFEDDAQPAFAAADFTPPLAEFDKAGLTALGRVFQAQDAPPARASVSRVETIFPRVV